MDGRNGWMDGCTDGWADEWTERWVDKWTDRWTDTVWVLQMFLRGAVCQVVGVVPCPFPRGEVARSAAESRVDILHQGAHTVGLGPLMTTSLQSTGLFFICVKRPSTSGGARLDKPTPACPGEDELLRWALNSPPSF